MLCYYGHVMNYVIGKLNDTLLVDCSRINYVGKWRTCKRLTQWRKASCDGTLDEFYYCYSLAFYIEDITYCCFNLEYDFMFALPLGYKVNSILALQ